MLRWYRFLLIYFKTKLNTPQPLIVKLSFYLLPEYIKKKIPKSMRITFTKFEDYVFIPVEVAGGVLGVAGDVEFVVVPWSTRNLKAN